MAFKRYIVWQDAGGRTKATIPCTSTGATAIQAALAAQSNAAVQEYFEGADNVLFPSPTSAIYPDVTDMARLTFTDGFGSLANLSLPAPVGSIFLADGSTVNSAAIAAIITAAVGNLCSAGGSTVTAFVSGQRVSKPNSDSI